MTFVLEQQQHSHESSPDTLASSLIMDTLIM